MCFMFVGPSEVSYSDVFTYIGGRLILICRWDGSRSTPLSADVQHLQGFRGRHGCSLLTYNSRKIRKKSHFLFCLTL